MDDAESVSADPIATVPKRGDNFGPNLAYRDLREWLEEAANMGAVKVVKGATMSSYIPVQFKAVLIRGAVALAIVIGLSTSFGAAADNHYFSLKKIFPNGKCSPVIPHYELMISGFAGGEFTKYKIHDDQGKLVEVISSFVNKDRDQWALVGSKTDSKVIFCLYASGSGKGSVDSRTIESE